MTAPQAGDAVRVFDDRASMDRAAAAFISEHALSMVEARGRFSIALSGGHTPRGLFPLLASSAYRVRIDWTRTHVFWADERCVPPGHEDSNYRLAAELLLSKVPIVPDHIHRIHGEKRPAAAAAAYEKELRSFFAEDPFTFDLVLLGMGDDGHTASLFPADPAINETGRLAVPVPASGLRKARVTLTLTAINGARAVLFLVAGAEKAPVVREVLEGRSASIYPAGQVRPARGSLLWFLDREAASRKGATS